jgi:hypothetical protein
VLAAGTAGMMGKRFAASGAVFPAGLVAALSIAMVRVLSTGRCLRLFFVHPGPLALRRARFTRG